MPLLHETKKVGFFHISEAWLYTPGRLSPLSSFRLSHSSLFAILQGSDKRTELSRKSPPSSSTSGKPLPSLPAGEALPAAAQPPPRPRSRPRRSSPAASAAVTAQGVSRSPRQRRPRDGAAPSAAGRRKGRWGPHSPAVHGPHSHGHLH